MVIYSVTTELWEQEVREPVRCYGIAGRCSDGGEPGELVIPAISTDLAFVEGLCERLRRNGVSLVHMKDVIEDALWEREQVPFARIG